MTFRIYFLVAGCMILTPGPSWSQPHDSIPSAHHYTLNAAYLKSYWYDCRSIAVSPFHWNGGQWAGAAGVTVASLFVYTKDARIQEVFQKNRSRGGDRFSRVVLEPWGSGWYSLPLMGAFYLEGLIGKNERSKKTALLGIKTFIITGLYSRIPKYTLQRHRPFQDTPGQPEKWEGPLHGLSEYTSFPSGHAVSAFAMATVLASEYAEYPAITFLSYSLATAVSLSRIYDNQHWASDALVGAAFGYAMGKLIHQQNNWLNGGKKNHRRKLPLE